ncbi:7124_t:CDS:2, partial [Scutellospora calospora]
MSRHQVRRNILDTSIINQINKNLNKKINELKNKNEEIQRQILTLNNDLYYERTLNERIITNQQTQIDLETRKEISAGVLNKR